jgi:hypothetical protein
MTQACAITRAPKDTMGVSLSFEAEHICHLLLACRGERFTAVPHAPCISQSDHHHTVALPSLQWAPYAGRAAQSLALSLAVRCAAPTQPHAPIRYAACV